MNNIKVPTSEDRIKILDSYRFIAILSVMLYHYYSRWTPPQNKVSLYPYGSKYDYFSLGWLGVNFFFIISGFVIAFSLTRTNGFIEFWKKRIIRLLPSMFICSLVTLIVICIVDTNMLFPDSHSFKNFLYSLTLLSPELLNKLFLFKIPGNYINGSYWSIWTEIQFYILASCIYFINRKNFVRNIAVFIITLCIVDFIVTLVLTNVHSLYSLYFAIGVLFFQLYSKEKIIMTVTLLVISMLLLLFLGGGFNFKQFLPIHTIFIMILLFVLFIYFSKNLNFLALKPISNIGAASYSLYLIHEVIGVLFINKYASIFGTYDYLFPIIIILLMIGFALLSYKYIEKPIGAYLKKKLI